MQKQPSYTVVLCQDCVMAVENGDTSGNSPEWQERFNNNSNVDCDITIGHLCSDSVHCFHMGESCEDDCNCAISDFSNRECYLCNTTDAGYRHDYTVWE